MAHMERSEAFMKNDYVMIDTKASVPYYGTVIKQDHQWLFTSVGIFNLAHPDVKAWRKVI